jgi:outer membrane lipase/esterase
MRGILQRSRIMLSAAGLLLAAVLMPAAVAQTVPVNLPFQRVTVFGDSLSDTGNLGRLAPPAPYFDKRFSNGPIWVDQFAALTVKPTKSLAYGGAKAKPDLPIDLYGQVIRFLAEEGRAAPDRLYVIWIGSNDLLDYVQRGGDADPGAYVRATVRNTVRALEVLRLAGGRRFAVLNVPDIGRTPLIAAAGSTAVIRSGQLVAMYNGTLASELASFRRRSSGTTVTLVDVDATIRQILQNPQGLGLTNLTRPCINSAGTAPFTPTGACATPEATAAAAFWDRLHPTSKVHGAIARAVLTAVTPR